MSTIRYLLSHPVEASRTFWRAFAGKETLSERIADEQARLKSLRMAIGLYHMQLGRFPVTLRDLCFNSHDDSRWCGAFIRWRGEDTFHDTFGFPYRYAVADGRFELVSPGLETATQC